MMKKYIKPTIVWMEMDNEMPLATSLRIDSDTPAWEGGCAKGNADADWGEDESAESGNWE